jgi:hypothetical protein
MPPARKLDAPPVADRREGLDMPLSAKARAPAAPRLARPAPEDEARVREAFAEALRDPGRALTPEELRRWAETGEWPES